MLRTRFLFVVAGLGVAMFGMVGRHVGGSAAPGIVPGPHSDSIRPNAPSPRPTLWQIREALPAPRMKFDADAPIVDVPAEAAETPPGPSDLDPTIDVQITQEIIDKAAELGSAQAMYEFVRNECAFQAYFGSQKGSVETLHQRAGNDYDLASLLIALLRASDIPARYAVGMVEMDTEEVLSWLAVDDGTVAGSILFTHGMEGIILIDGGGNVVAVRARRVWVEAFVSSGFGSPTWVPLDPAFLMKSVHEGLDIPEAMGLDALAFIDDYWDPSDPKVILPRLETPVELLKEAIGEYLDANLPGLTLEDVIRTSEIVPQHLGLLPNSLPYTVRSRDTQYSEIPADRRYQIRFHLYDGGTGLIDHTVNLPEIAGKRVTIDYEGATSGDQDILDANGGIYQTAPSAVDLRPVLRINGQVAAVGAAGVGMGLLHSSDVHFLAPTNGMGLPGNVVPAIFNVITTGASQAIGLAIEGAAENLLIAPPADDTEGTLSLLYETAVDYMAGVRSAELDLGRLMHDFVTTGVTSAILENVVKVTFSGGVPQTFDWAGLRVDADRSILGVWPVEEFVPASAEPKDFLVIAGAEGSMREHHIFEDSFAQISVSTIKILELAVDASVTVYKRWNTLPLPANSQPASVRQALENAIASGNEVTFPADPITVGEPATGQWSGTGWISMDPANGAAGYIISGNNNGGATVEFWPPEFIDLQEGDRDVTNVEIEITNPVNDSPDPPAVFTRDNEQHLEFEYLVHVDYDDGSSATLGPYKRTTHNTTKTFVPGNYEFHVWIARFPWWGLLAEAERKISIVGVLIREDDGTDLGKDPPKFLPADPPAPAATPFVNVKALVIPDKDPNGAPLASGYAWSGDPADKLTFVTPSLQTTKIEPSGADPSGAIDDQVVKVVVNLPGGKQQRGFAKLNFAQGGQDEKHKMTVFKARLKELSYSGTGYHVVREDDGSADYAGPHWQDNNDDADAADSGDRRYPVSFERNEKMMVTMKAIIEPSAVLAGTPKLRGDGPGSLDVPETNATVSGTELTITDINTSGMLANEIQFLNPLMLVVEVKLDGDTKWWSVGTADNRVYVTLAAPTASPLYETLLDIGCRNAHGKTTAADAVSSIWSDFTGPIPGVLRKAMDGHNVPDGTEMKYWNPPAAVCQSLAGMLADPNGNGSCVAWAQLLHETLRAQGIAGSTVVQLRHPNYPASTDFGFLVKDWNFGNHVRTGPNGLRNTATAGDDAALFPIGDGLANTDCILPGPDATLDTTAAGDDVVVGTKITTGANGRCESTKAGDDVQAIPVGQGAPDQACIGPGPDGVLDSTNGGDDTDQDGVFAGTTYPYVQGFDAVDQLGVPGQSNPNPPGGFFNHFITRYGGEYYDPSYGAGIFATANDHETAAIDAIFFMNRARKQAPAQELIYSP